MKTTNVTIPLVLTLLLFINTLTSSCLGPLPVEANKNYEQLKMNKALPLLEKMALQNEMPSKEKAETYLKIARIFAKAYENKDSALFYLNKGLTIADPSQKREYAKQLANYYLATSGMDNARKNAEDFLSFSQNQRDSLDANTLLLSVKLATLEKEVMAGHQVSADLTNETLKLAEAIYAIQPESPVNNERRLALYLLKGMGSEATSALKDYFFIGSDPLTSSFYEKRIEQFNGLAVKLPTEGFTVNDKTTLVNLLGEFRFYTISEVLSSYLNVANDPEVQETLAYAKFRNEFERAVNTHYAGILAGKEDDNGLKKQLDICHRDLWAKIKSCAGKPYNYDSLVAIGGRMFGMNTFMKERGDYHIYICGDAVYFHNDDVEQYGYKAPYHFYLVDHIVGTNVRGYYYDYFEWGGWSEKDLVMENRRIVLEGSIALWEKIAGKLTSQVEAEMVQIAQKDDQSLSGKELTDLPGLRARLELSSLCYLRDSIMKAGFTGAELRKKAISQIKYNDFLSSTLAHEGRHVIDVTHKFIGGDHVESELRANLSSVIFAPSPKMSLSRILIYNPEAKDPTGHHKADAKIVEGFLSWMKEHKNEIAGYDASRPLLSQADKLGNSQIIAICRGMDPLSKK